VSPSPSPTPTSLPPLTLTSTLPCVTFLPGPPRASSWIFPSSVDDADFDPHRSPQLSRQPPLSLMEYRPPRIDPLFSPILTRMSRPPSPAFLFLLPRAQSLTELAKHPLFFISRSFSFLVPPILQPLNLEHVPRPLRYGTSFFHFFRSLLATTVVRDFSWLCVACLSPSSFAASHPEVFSIIGNTVTRFCH